MRAPVALSAVALLVAVACGPSSRADPEGGSPLAAAVPEAPDAGASPLATLDADVGVAPVATAAALVEPVAVPNAAPASGFGSQLAEASAVARRRTTIADENAKPGTATWRIAGANGKPSRPDAWIEGYANVSSAAVGDTITLFVDTPRPTWRVRALRMGWYGGREAREVWVSGAMPGGRQRPPSVDARTGMAEARWSPSLTVTITDDWPPGAYLLRLEADDGAAHFVPLTVRDDASAADLVVINAVTTWQAYNDWGGCSLYQCLSHKRRRATVVSFDRPYFHPYGGGAADFTTHELPLIAAIERAGLDVAYLTDLDLHQAPWALRRHRAVISPGHDEYYSDSMLGALVSARTAGVNLAFLGANAVYRRIRLSPSWDGRLDRRMANYRGEVEPVPTGDRPTREWRALGQPEAALVGIQYRCAGVRGDLVVTGANRWLWRGTGVKNGQVLRQLVGNEYDSVAPSSPRGLELFASSPVTCNGERGTHVASYYNDPVSGAGVFATGTIWWVCAIDATCSRPQNAPIVERATLNLLELFARGPAGHAEPAQPTSRRSSASPPTRATPTTTRR